MKTIRMEKLYATIQPLIPTITLFSNKQDEVDAPLDTYVYLGLVSDNITNASMQGYTIKEARVAFTIVCKTVLGVNETEESVLFDVIELLDDTLAREACNKINVTDDIIIQEIQSSTLSPIFYNIKDRAYIVKDFIIKYEA